MLLRSASYLAWQWFGTVRRKFLRSLCVLESCWTLLGKVWVLQLWSLAGLFIARWHMPCLTSSPSVHLHRFCYIFFPKKTKCILVSNSKQKFLSPSRNCPWWQWPVMTSCRWNIHQFHFLTNVKVVLSGIPSRHQTKTILGDKIIKLLFLFLLDLIVDVLCQWSKRLKKNR